MSSSYAVFCLKKKTAGRRGVVALHATHTTAIYTLSLHDALPIFGRASVAIAENQKSAIDFQPVKQCAGSVGVDGTCVGGQLHRQIISSGFAFVGTFPRSEEHTSELQSHVKLVCRLLLEKKNRGPSRRRCFARYTHHRHLHSFPTRRSSDLRPGFRRHSRKPKERDRFSTRQTMCRKCRR